MKESVGTSIVKKEGDLAFNEPDNTLPPANLIYTTRAASPPKHWNNSPFLSGSFGSNAKNKKKNKNKMSHIIDFKSFRKVEEQAVTDPFKSEKDSIIQLDNAIKQLEMELAKKKVERINKQQKIDAAEATAQATAQAEAARQQNLNP